MAMAPRPLTPQVINNLLTDRKQYESDTKRLREYWFENVFPVTVFLLDDQALVVGGDLYNLFRQKCVGLMCNGRLLGQSEPLIDLYMASRWKDWQIRKKGAKVIYDKGIRNWYHSWRSNVYEKVQAQFIGKLHLWCSNTCFLSSAFAL